MSACVILNPYASRWEAGKRRDEVALALAGAGIEHVLKISEAPGHATRLAAEARLQGHTPIIAAGGDGTIGEVLNGLWAPDEEPPIGPFGVIPLGTANDFVKNLGLPKDLASAAAAIREGRTRRVDLGQVNDWIFANNSAVGLEPVVTIFNMRMVRLRGVIRYLVAALRAIHSKPEWTMEIQWDSGDYEGPASLVSVGNGAVTGGLFRMAPAADPADGLLTFVFGYAPTRRKMLSLLPRTISGTFVQDPVIQQHHTTKLTIRTTPATPLQADGELRATDLELATYQILPGRLELIAP